MAEREYQQTGDGECKLVTQCHNRRGDYCYVCMYNTAATPQDYYEGEELSEEERANLIES